MKGKIAIGITLALAATFVAFGVALAHGSPPRPPEPTCPLASDPLATDTVTPAVWHEATYACPVVTFETSREVCPAGYDAHGSTCRKWDWEHWRWVYADKITETFGPIDVAYVKSSDPTKCHRPTASSLGVPSWAESDFNKLPEHKDSIKTEGYWDDPVCARPPVLGCTDRTAWNYNPEATQDDGSCVYDVCSNLEGLQATIPEGYEDKEQNGTCTPIVIPIPGCTDEAALNYDPEATVDDGSCEYPPEPVDVCPNIEGDQETIPSGMVKDEQGNCVEAPQPVCELKHLYYQYTLTNQGDVCYMVTWDRKDEIDKPNEFWIPNIDRQKCSCGWIAENAPYGGWVSVDCHGDYWYDGKPWAFYEQKMEKPHWSLSCGVGGGGGECPAP